MCGMCGPKWWLKIRMAGRILIGVLMIFLGIYDFFYPGTKTESTVDLRDITLDCFFLAFGVLLTFGTVFESLYTMSGFTFLQNSFGAGLFMIFSGFLAIKSFQIDQFPTWGGIILLFFGVIFLIDGFEVLCCCCERENSTGTPDEKKTLLGGKKGATPAPSTGEQSSKTATSNAGVEKDTV